MSIVGNIVTGNQVASAAVAWINTWFSTYLAELEEADATRDRMDLARPFSVQVNTERNKFSEDRLPAIICVCPGLAERPVKDGEGKFRAKWILGVACVVKGRDRQTTDEICSMYTAAVRTLLVQKPSLGISGRGVEWVDEDYDELDSDDRRTLKAGLLTFWVEVGDVVTAGIGPVGDTPPVPPSDPLPDWPTVAQDKTFLTIDSEGISE